ncbi:ligand-binding sensor domain-containing diguanylate cyclase [Pseudoalteromonas ruthenica]|uniref:ligand-binding sensor domain-containing diguanylate cyclase n=1 Tax=Pseudoalteromonas ruthenica TaxID=151081 RepID=UPI00110B448D|nr:ligand-binding sensor domain-containing diguanylate cyclase [Pseudoalteromonas ruthenica]TMO44423.1 GGDEF domain-containing protein [Pseudoalteromonas ruthenica]TMO49633.1 GGDEF domain-containing protein [Pseudoalteromonas ruthenica]
MKIILYLAISLLSLSSFANQVPKNIPSNVPLSHYFAETWDTRDGLPHNSVNALAQTPDGYVWVGTWEGVARFNGRTFKLFTRGVLTGLPDSGIRSLNVDKATQQLYVAGSRGGISVVERERWQALKPAQTMVNFAVRSGDGALWLALEDGGLVRRTQQSDEQNLLPNISAYQVFEQQEGRIWAATNNGLYYYEDGAMHSADSDNSAITGAIYSLAEDRDGALLVGTEQGVWRYVNNEFTLLHNALADDSVSSILVDFRGDIWLGTINQGVFRFSEYGLEKLDANVGLPSNRILSLLEDNEHSIWIGTNGGLFRLRQAPFTTVNTARGLSGDYVRSVLSHTDGALYIGTSNGLNRYTQGQVEQISSPLDAPISVLSLTSSQRGGVYVGTYTSGLMYFDGQRLTTVINRDTGLPSNEVRALHEQADGTLWIGTAGGLVRMKNAEEVTTLTDKQGLPGNFIMALAQDKQQRLWIGTGVGVAFYHQGQFTTLPLREHFDADYAFGFLVQDDALWMATDRGLLHYDYQSHRLRKLGREQGLPVDKLFAVVNDKYDHLWLSSNRGVIRISQAHVMASLDSEDAQLEFTLFDEGDGMLSSQANGGSQYPAVRHHDDSVWIATARGAAVVDPAKLVRMASVSLPVSIESIGFDDEQGFLPNLDKTSLTVPSETDRLSIAYAGLGFIMPERIEYQTKLKGFDDNWINRGNLTLTEYTNLPPGNYEFHVRARYPYSEWPASATSFHFTITPKFWQTLSFKVAMIVVLALALFTLYRLRFLHLKRSEAQLKLRVQAQTRSLAEQAKAFEHQATHDQLTGVANRRAFDKWLIAHFEQAKQQQQPLSLAIIDIDHFKNINDKYSHMVGDKVITEVANLIHHCAPQEAMFARWGGEEFTLLLPGFSVHEAQVCAERIRVLISGHDYSALADGVHITVSIGVADSQGAQDYDRMLAQADNALYQAKQGGRNQVVVYQKPMP